MRYQKALHQLALTTVIGSLLVRASTSSTLEKPRTWPIGRAAQHRNAIGIPLGAPEAGAVVYSVRHGPELAIQ